MMKHEKQQGNPLPGRFRIGDSVELMAMRQRHQELSGKIGSGAVSEAEKEEFLRLDDALRRENAPARGNKAG